MNLLIRKVQFAVGAAIAALLLVAAISYHSVLVSSRSDHWVSHTHEVLEHLKDLLFAMEAIDTDYREFVVLEKESYFTAYEASLATAVSEEARVRALTQDNPNQQVRIAEVERLGAEKARISADVIAIRRAKGLDAAVDLMRSGSALSVLSKIHDEIRQMEDEELRLLSARDLDAKRRTGQTKAIVLLGTAFGLLIAIGAGLAVSRESSARGVDQEARREGEERFRNVANNISQLAWIADKSGRFLWYNQRWFDYFGTTAEEMEKPEWAYGVHHLEHFNRVMLKFNACLVSGEVWEDTFPLLGQDGVFRWFLSRAVPIRDAGGNVLRWFGTNTDISELEESKRNIAQMEARYRGLLEAAPDAMVVVDTDGEIVLLNVQAEMQFGYSRDELLGKKVTSIIPQGFAERLIADGTRTASEALAQQIGMGIELTGMRKDRSQFPIEIMLSPLKSAEGTLVTAAIRNISVRKAAEAHLARKVEELNRSNQELEQFAYLASHDLQEPLRMVASYTQLLSRRYKGKLDSDADDFIAFAVDGATRMQRLIQDLLAYSRAGTRIKLVDHTSSEEALRQALRNLRMSIEDSGAIVTSDPLPAVYGDESQLTLLFQNLVGNAIKYQKNGTPRIHVSSLDNHDNTWDFSVQDNGLGIEPQFFERIFGMFQRLHKREEFAGTGIGLAICKKIVERHGGRISVESEPGHGSTFHFGLSGSGVKP